MPHRKPGRTPRERQLASLLILYSRTVSHKHQPFYTVASGPVRYIRTECNKRTVQLTILYPPAIRIFAQRGGAVCESDCQSDMTHENGNICELATAANWEHSAYVAYHEHQRLLGAFALN